MHQYNKSGPSERIAFNIRGPLVKSQMGNQHFLIDVDYLSKWQEAYAIPNQEEFMVTGVLVTNLFCHFRVPRELHSDQGCNFKS
jgi:hypothetical protein